MPLKIGLMILFVGMLSGCANESCENDVISILNPTQTSAKLLMDYTKTAVCQSRGDGTAKPATPNDERKLVLVYDLYVKARSYALLNKLFFGLSLVSAIAVLLWPALGVLMKDRLGQRDWYQSAIVQTTVTGIAALMFAFYSQYKDKQTYTENLMRYAVFSDKPVFELSQKIIEEVGKIDSGFSFGGVFDASEKASSGQP